MNMPGATKIRSRPVTETVNTRGLCDSAAEQHGARHIALALRLTADGLQCLCDSVALTDTGSDTGDQCATRTDAATHERDTSCKKLKICHDSILLNVGDCKCRLTLRTHSQCT